MQPIGFLGRKTAMPIVRLGRKLCRLRHLIVAVAALGLHPSLASAAELTELKVGISEPVNTALALWMAEAGGFYAAQGLNVEIINQNGGSRGAQELQSGRI